MHLWDDAVALAESQGLRLTCPAQLPTGKALERVQAKGSALLRFERI